MSVKQFQILCDGPEGTNMAVMARLVDAADANLVQASFSAGAYTVYDAATGVVVTASTALVIATVMFNTLQTGNGWSRDSEGYNFRAVIPASKLPTAAVDKEYKVVFLFTFFIDTSAGVLSLQVLRRQQNVLGLPAP